MTKLWNMMNLRQQLKLQDAIRWGTLFGATISFVLGGVKNDTVLFVAGWIYALVFWYAQCREGKDER